MGEELLKKTQLLKKGKYFNQCKINTFIINPIFFSWPKLWSSVIRVLQNRTIVRGKNHCCEFDIYFTDKVILSKSKVKKCGKKKPMHVEHVRDTKSRHILTLKLEIFKNGKGRIKYDSNVQTSKIFYSMQN